MITKKTMSAIYGHQKDRYMELICQFPLRPIRNDRELAEATVVARSLYLKPESKLTSAESDYLDVLDRLIEKYEDETVPIDEGTEADLITFLMESNAITQTQLAKGVGIATSTVSEVLSGKRKLTRKQIEKLAAYFKVSPAVFHSKV